MNVSQLTSIASGITAGLQSQINRLQSQVNQVNQRVDTANAGAAMAMALSGGFLPDQKNFAVAFNYGTFQGQNAAALSTFLRMNEYVVFSAGMSYGVEAKQLGGRAGLLFAW
ncbi:MAG TPA: YadA-like family protein [Xanthobacteraceae bacterium]|nr:YadA-like family protein [Xanthobacteraceae bacterium]